MIDKIKEILAKLKLSQKLFAEKLDIPYSRFNNYLNGTRKLPVDILTQIVDLFDINATWLLTGEGEMFKTEVAATPKAVPKKISESDEVVRLRAENKELIKESGKLELLLEQKSKEQPETKKHSTLELSFDNKPKVRTPESIAKDKTVIPFNGVKTKIVELPEVENTNLKLYEGRVACGAGGIVEDTYEMFNFRNFITRNKEVAHMLQLTGDSMVYSGINDGDYAIIDLNKKSDFKRDELVVAELEIDGRIEYVCKRYQHNGISKVLRSDNYHYPDIIVNDTVKIIGSVTGIYRRINQ